MRSLSSEKMPSPVKKIVELVKSRHYLPQRTKEITTEATPVHTKIDGEEVEDLVEWVKNLVEEGKSVRDHDVADFGDKSFCDRMAEYHLWDVGRHWDSNTTPYNENKTDPSDLRKENRIQQALDVIVSMVLSNRPQINISPEAGSTVQACDWLQQILSADFDEMQFDEHFKMMVRNTRKFGFSVVKLYHNWLENEPYGVDVMYVCDPLSILWVGGTEFEGEEKVKAVIEVRQRRKRDVEREFNVTDLIADDEITDFELSTYMNAYQSSTQPFEKVKTIEVWLDDTTMEEREYARKVPALDREEQPIGAVEGMGPFFVTETGVEKVRKYPEGRRIVVCGNTLLYDKPNPYSKAKGGHGLFPFSKLVNRPRTGHFCGVSDIEVIKDQQKDINAVITQISVNAALTANNQREIDVQALEKGFTKEQITNEPGLDIPVKAGMAGKAVALVPQGTISPESATKYINAVKAMEDILGAQEISRGLAPASDSGIKVRSLDVFANRRLGPFVIAMEVEARRLALLEIGNLFQFKGEDEMYSVIAEIPDPEETDLENPQLPLQEGLVALRWGELKGEGLKYKVKIGFMSSVNTYRQAKFQNIIQLLTLVQNLPPDFVIDVIIKNSDSAEIQEEWKKYKEKHRDELSMLSAMATNPVMQQAMKQRGVQPGMGAGTPSLRNI